MLLERQPGAIQYWKAAALGWNASIFSHGKQSAAFNAVPLPGSSAGLSWLQGTLASNWPRALLGQIPDRVQFGALLSLDPNYSAYPGVSSCNTAGGMFGRGLSPPALQAPASGGIQAPCHPHPPREPEGPKELGYRSEEECVVVQARFLSSPRG